MTRLLWTLPVLVLLAACGGGGGAKKADYLKKAEAICSKANTDQDALTSPTAVADIPPYIDKVLALADQATSDLKALEVPKGDKAELDKRFLVPLSKQVEEGRTFGEKVTAAAKTKDNATLTKLISHPPLATKADLTWMKRYGFKECVKAADTES
ncbi:MAG: hypothetical protein WCD35_17660 [Mycobacteriales bacterium]